MYSLQCITIVLVLIVTLTAGYVKFTNIKCVDLQPEFSTFIQCRLKMVKRSTVSLNLYHKLFKVPVNNVSINLSLHKKFNGYRPFMYNVTLDYCRFQKNPQQNLFVKIYQDLFQKYSNINHSCPFDHDIIIKDLILDEEMFKLLPLPHGEYLFKLKVGAYNDWKAEVFAYMTFGLSFSDD